MFENMNFERYILVPWPYCQQLQELPGFEEHSETANFDDDVDCSYFVEESWFNGVTETESL